MGKQMLFRRNIWHNYLVSKEGILLCSQKDFSLSYTPSYQSNKTLSMVFLSSQFS